MQVLSVISNSITQDIRLKGHQSIRFTPDGFSVLVSDASYTPVYLQQYIFEPLLPGKELITECVRILDETELFSFEGEIILITDSMAATLVPESFFNEAVERDILEAICSLDKSDQIFNRPISNRKARLVYAIPERIIELGKKFESEVKIIHTAECLVSLSDQVKSSDHQRGAIMAEVQSHTLDILVIKGDHLQLLNRYTLNDPSDFIYHVLNTMKQLKLDCESIPVYLSGIINENHELQELIGKYIRNVISTPYYLEHLSREEILQHMILSEGSKCV